MKKLAVILAIIFQLAALAWMALSREYVLQTGSLVKLQTAPIDPRDLFRGDFVRLRYAMSQVSGTLLARELQGRVLKKGGVLYAALETSATGLVTVTSIHANPPADGSQFIKGRISNDWHPTSNQALQLKFGIEQYFVEQGKGLEIENRRGRRNDVQLPMIMQVALSDDGTAILKGHEWSKLGIGLSVKQQPEADALPEVASATFQLVLKNLGDENLELPLKPGTCSFSIVSIVSVPKRITRKARSCDSQQVVMQVLPPGESLNLLFDFNDVQWNVDFKDKPTPLGKLPWSYRFRIIYDEVDETEMIGSEIVSRAFHGRGQVD